MSIEQKIEGNVGKLFLSDEIDLDKSPTVRENLKDLIDKVKTIEVQMSKVKYIDSSAQEKSAEFASKQVIQNLLCEYAANFKGKSFKGFITGVKDFGLFVDVPKLFTSG